ncbi:hypothetical protein K469DRAFT_107580 [Zopfia rhizophila CBS 207.26]|uniref:Uncharacterized protein n=1 Tax=Zopfia rhizophila CBS 207.26 TaxID=1314779 RepID=A0A6A6E784_9PEZI|nr:hypothetical protein K469DRAFT_107580 [Zopfia rhizophila CBS 207.26]
MPLLKELNCSVELTGTKEELQEHGTVYGDGVAETFIAVPSEPKPFSVHLTSTRFIAPGLSMFVYIDGVYQCNRSRQGLMIPTGVDKPPDDRSSVDLRVHQKEEQRVDGKLIAREWNFDKLNIVSANEATDVCSDILDNIGCIEVIVLRCTGRRETNIGGFLDGAGDIPEHIFSLDGPSSSLDSPFNEPSYFRQAQSRGRHSRGDSLSENRYPSHGNSQGVRSFVSERDHPQNSPQHHCSRSLSPWVQYGTGPIPRDREADAESDIFWGRSPAAHQANGPTPNADWLSEIMQDAYKQGLEASHQGKEKEGVEGHEKEKKHFGSRLKSQHLLPRSWPSPDVPLVVPPAISGGRSDDRRFESARDNHWGPEPSYSNNDSWSKLGAGGPALSASQKASTADQWIMNSDVDTWSSSDRVTRMPPPPPPPFGTKRIRSRNGNYKKKLSRSPPGPQDWWGSSDLKKQRKPLGLSVPSPYTPSLYYISDNSSGWGNTDSATCSSRGTAKKQDEYSGASQSTWASAEKQESPPTSPGWYKSDDGTENNQSHGWGDNSARAEEDAWGNNAQSGKKDDKGNDGNQGSWDDNDQTNACDKKGSNDMPGGWNNNEESKDDQGKSGDKADDDSGANNDSNGFDNGCDNWGNADSNSQNNDAWGARNNDSGNQNNNMPGSWDPDHVWGNNNHSNNANGTGDGGDQSRGNNESNDQQENTRGNENSNDQKNVWGNDNSKDQNNTWGNNGSNDQNNAWGNDNSNSQNNTWAGDGFNQPDPGADDDKKSISNKSTKSNKSSSSRLKDYRRFRNPPSASPRSFPPPAVKKPLRPIPEDLEGVFTKGEPKEGQRYYEESLFNIPPSKAKEEHLEHQVRPGKGTKYNHCVGRPEYMDMLEKPYALFRFKYRSRDVLKKMFGDEIPDGEIMPNDSEDMIKEKLQNLSKEEMIAEFLRLRTSAGAKEAFSKSSNRTATSIQGRGDNNAWETQSKKSGKPASKAPSKAGSNHGASQGGRVAGA